MTSTDDRLKNIFVNLFFIGSEELKENTSADDIPAWDSLQHLNLIVAIEEEFNISISHEEATEMLNFGLVKLLVEEKL